MSTATSTIMVVEDDEYIREAITQILENEGYNVVTLTNGRDALIYLRNSKRTPCCVLLDLFMPVMNGKEMMEALQEQDMIISIPIIIMSAATNIERHVPGAHDYIRKPADVDGILNVVKKYCNVRH